jgi:hypothetical protein
MAGFGFGWAGLPKKRPLGGPGIQPLENHSPDLLSISLDTKFLGFNGRTDPHKNAGRVYKKQCPYKFRS